jgi:hypothetical protein
MVPYAQNPGFECSEAKAGVNALSSNPVSSWKPGFSVLGRSMLNFELFRINQTGLAIYRSGSATALHPLSTLKIEGSCTARPMGAKEKNQIFF